MKQITAFDFANTIRTHATIVGALYALGSIGAVALGATWHLIDDPTVNPEWFILTRNVLIFGGTLHLFLTLFYWIGFLQRVRWCLTVCLVFIIVTFALQTLVFLGCLKALNTVYILRSLIGLYVKGYVWLVVAQLRAMMSNVGLLTYSEKIETMAERKTPL